MLSVIASSLYCSYFVKRPTMLYKKKKRLKPTNASPHSLIFIHNWSSSKHL